MVNLHSVKYLILIYLLSIFNYFNKSVSTALAKQTKLSKRGCSCSELQEKINTQGKDISSQNVKILELTEMLNKTEKDNENFKLTVQNQYLRDQVENLEKFKVC